MRAVIVTRHGPPEVLEAREMPELSPGPEQVRIAVAAAGVNFAEISARQGLYPQAPPPPCVLGYEAAGIVDAIGSAITTVDVGQRVLAITPFGGQASQVLVRPELVLPIPDKMTFTQAAAIPVAYLTAHHMLYFIGNVRPRSTVLVHAAAGGVGTAALQLLRLVPELTIFGTASRSKHDRLREMGCTYPIDYHTEDYAEVVMRATHGRGVDVVLDALGGHDWRKGYDILAPAGRLVMFGFANAVGASSRNYLRILFEGIRLPFFGSWKLLNENRTVQGVNMANLWSEAALLRPQLERVIQLYDRGVVKPEVFAEVSFSRAADAHRILESRQNIGKVVLVPD